MRDYETLTITDDSQLEQFGIFTTESHQPDQGVFLSRQDFRDVQQDELDVYPTDEAFLLTLLATIERGSGQSMRPGWSDSAKHSRMYVQNKRPSQPDFLIDPHKANGVFLASRYWDSSLVDSRMLGMNRPRLATLRGALARVGIDGLMTMEEFEQPLRLSGDIFITPPWCEEMLGQDPHMLTFGDFKSWSRSMRIDEDLAHAAFRYIARELLDDGRADSAETHEFAHEYFGRMRYIDSAIGLLTLDVVAAYRVVFEQWRSQMEAGKELPFEGSADEQEYYVKRPKELEKLVKLAQKTLSEKVSHNWFNRDGKFRPPRREPDFEF